MTNLASAAPRAAGQPDWRDRCYSDYSYYDAPDSDTGVERRAEKYAKSLALTSMRAPCRILEIGFGEGHFLDWAAQRGHQTQGVEVIPSLVDGVAARGHKVRLGTIFDLAPPAESLDLIVAFHVFEHLYPDELIDTLEMSYRTLRPGGQILIEVPNAATPFSHRLVHGSMTHVSYLTTNSVKQFGRAVGLTCHYQGNAPRLISGGRSALAKRLAYFARDVIEVAYCAIYNGGGRLPLDPAVTIVLEKPKGPREIRP